MTGRRLTTTLTMSGLALVLCVMAIWGYHAATRPLPDQDASTTTKCTKAEITKQYHVHRGEVTVSIYNAGARSGFARLTLQRFEDFGFQAGAVGNAPKGAHVRRAKVFTTKKHDTAAKLVARTLGGRVAIKVVDQDLGPGINVYVGPRMRHLNRKAPKRLKLPQPKETCVRVDE